MQNFAPKQRSAPKGMIEIYVRCSACRTEIVVDTVDELEAARRRRRGKRPIRGRI